MPRALVIVLQLPLGFALTVSLFAQVVVIPTMAADEVELFPPYAPLQKPLVTVAILFVACVQAGLVALIFLLGRAGAGTLFEWSALVWVNALVGVAAAATAVTLGLFVYVTFADIPSPADGMEVIGLWMGSAAGVAAGVVLLLLTIVGRHLLTKAIALRAELDEVI